MRRRGLIFATVVLVALSISPAAAPHGGGAAKGYESTITAITPQTAAIEAAVVDADDRVQLRVLGDHVVVVHGYEKEPYLRFDSTGVYRNERSPATYLNDDRYGKVELPAAADPRATPVWTKVAPAGRSYEWHDHRIHWMNTTYPPVVAADTSVPHHIYDWTVPGTLDGKPLRIDGSLDYAPLPDQKFPVLLIVPLVLVAVGGVVLVVLRNRRPAS